MRTKIKLTGNPITDLKILESECSNNNQICYHIKNNNYIIDYLKTITGIEAPVMVLLYHFKNNLKEVPKCICGKDRQYHCSSYRPTCGNMKCQNIVREDSKKKCCMEKYGVEYTFQLQSVKEKSKITCLEKYGVDNCTKSNDIIRKRKENNLLKYGVTDTLMIRSLRNDYQRGLDKIQTGLPEGYKVLESDRSQYYQLECPKGHQFEISKYSLYLKKKNSIEICNYCNEYIGSNGEHEVYNYILSIYSGKIKRSDRKLITPFEIDIMLPEIDTCIEFNGDYWHSECIKNKYYHINKLNYCLMKGYNLLQIREHDWNTNKDVIKRKLFNIVNNIYSKDDLNIEDGHLIFDLSWYDSRQITGMEDNLEYNIDPKLIKVGQYQQWDCGYRIYNLSL